MLSEGRIPSGSSSQPRVRQGSDDTQLKTRKKLTQHYTDIPQLTLNVDKSKITELNIENGSLMFAFWFVVSTYLPIMTACLCPMANMVSIAGLVTNWRSDPDTLDHIHDAKDVLVLNIFSLVMGAIGNVSIILNFGKRVSYTICQIVSIVCFFSASTFLLVAILIANHKYYDIEDFNKTDGFWFAVLTVLLYAGCCFLCALNFAGHLLGKYPADFNLSTSERGLIIYAFLLAVWFVWGAALFSHLIHISYSAALYYCVVSLLTIGLGDITPVTAVSRALSLLYSLTGVVILALIIAMIRSMISSKSRPVLFWNQVEINRRKVLKKIHEQELKLSQEDSFDLMRSIRRQARRHQRNQLSVITLIIFIAFWLMGAMIFHFTEGWDYFDAVYFCFLCLLTIGYGDFAPKSAAGRPVFIVWSLGAVPLMTALISNVGDTVYRVAMSGVSLSIVMKLFNRNGPLITRDIEHYMQERSEEELDMEEERTADEIMMMASKREKHVYARKSVFDGMKKLIVESKDDPSKRYGFKQWNTVMGLLELEDDEVEILGIDNDLFWLSDESPLRYPISEPNYLLFLLFSKMESLITEEIEMLKKMKGEESDGSEVKDLSDLSTKGTP